MLNRIVWFRFRRSQLVLTGLFGVFAGLVASRFGLLPELSLLLLGFVLAPIAISKNLLALVPILLVSVQLGLWRGQTFMVDAQRYEQLYGMEIVVEGRVSDDAGYTQYGQTEFHIEKITVQSEGQSESLRGRMRVRAFRAIGIARGDMVRVEGKVYPTLGNRQGSIGFAGVEILSRQPSLVERLRSEFFAGTYTAIPEPNASLGLGFLVGLRTLLPDQLLDELSATGLTHIVAVSGYNLTILVRLTRRLFAQKSLFMSMAMSVGLIVGFLLVTGLSPSISRAAVVSGFALAGWYYGRAIRPMMLIMLGAVVTGFINPYFIWYDLGWWLSFAAFFGVLVIAPLITQRLFREKPKLFGQLVIETTSAQIMALPIIAVVFGELSLISLLANVIILPLIPLAMILTFIAGLGGMLGPFVAGWFAWPANLLLTFMTDMISLMAKTPWALAEVELNWTYVSAFYAIILFLAVVLRFRNGKAVQATEVIE